MINYQMDNRPPHPQEPPGPRQRPADLPTSTIAQNATVTYYLAGFPCRKIRQMLEMIPNFATVDGPEYLAENLEKTCQFMQTDKRDAYTNTNRWLRIVMANPSPFQLRRGANNEFSERFPDKALEIGEAAEMAEMRIWQSRWREEVRLLKQSPYDDFKVQARKVAKELDEYQIQLVAEDKPRKKVSFVVEAFIQRAKSTSKKSDTPSPKRGRSRPSTRPSSPGGQLKPQKIPHPEMKDARPSLKLFTHVGNPRHQEGTTTPGKAQNLDVDGYFSPRPRTPSPAQNASRSSSNCRT